MTLLLWFVNIIEQRLDCVISQAKNQWNYYLIVLKKRGENLHQVWKKKQQLIAGKWLIFCTLNKLDFTMNKLDLKFVDMSLHWH